MQTTYKALAHRAGCIRKKYRLAPLEAASCALWLAGVHPDRLNAEATRMIEIKNRRYQKPCSTY